MPKLSELADAINIMQEISVSTGYLGSHKAEIGSILKNKLEMHVNRNPLLILIDY
jgi:hypothetical protein